MNDVTKTIHDPCTIEIETGGAINLQRVKAGSLTERVLGLHVGVPPQSLEQRVSRSDPLKIVLFRGLAVSRKARVPCRERLAFPIRLVLVLLQDSRSSGWFERVWKSGECLECE